MRLATTLFAILVLFPQPTGAGVSSTMFDSSYLPLLPPIDLTFPTLHTSLATLLPILPLLSPGPSHTLVVTFATPAFKTLLFNWLCFFRHRARWADPPLDASIPRARGIAGDVAKFLVVTSDEGLAEELSQMGIVVWWLKAANMDDLEEGEDESEGERTDEEEARMWVEWRDDIFLNLRLMDLLLPPEAKDPDDKPLRKDYIVWGSLQYQSLMLERSLVMSALVGAIVESQKIEVEDRKEQEADWQRAADAHDWETGPLVKEEFTGVKGVLVVDNDAVWLSSPSSFLAHHYRPSGTHPAIIYAPDSHPDFLNAWSTFSMPCACFLYARTSDHLAQSASSLPVEHADFYRPAASAAHVWRTTALCHVAMVLRELETGRRQATDLWDSTRSIEKLVRAKAPSFQATSLGPALFLAEQEVEALPRVSHEDWMRALSSGSIEDFQELLESAGLDLHSGSTCLDIAQRNWAISPNPHPGSLTPQSTLVPDNDKYRATRVEALPFGMFPPGMSYFGKDQEEGIKPCVVHANYAVGKEKEDLLRDGKLWALVGGGVEEWMCDAEVMRNA
ncbi:hypothetical protein P7C70_g1914, partial [Phenoliferia sp. Uapishka_3]